MFWDRPKRAPVFCVDCRWHTREGERHLCHHPKHVAVHTSFVTGEKEVIPLSCVFENPDGACREYAQRPPGEPPRWPGIVGDDL